MKKLLFGGLLASLLSLLACTDETLEVVRPEDSATFPEFNFNIETVAPRDTIRPGETITYNLYVRQQLVTVARRKYFVSFKLPQNFDGEAIINSTPWRSEDQVSIDYDQVVRQNYRVPFTYRPRHQGPGSYTLDFTCRDETGKTRTFSKQLTVR